MEGLGVGCGGVPQRCLRERRFGYKDCSCPTALADGKRAIAAFVFMGTSVPEPCMSKQAKAVLWMACMDSGEFAARQLAGRAARANLARVAPREPKTSMTVGGWCFSCTQPGRFTARSSAGPLLRGI